MSGDQPRRAKWERMIKPTVGVHIEQNRLCAVEIQRGVITGWTQALLEGDAKTDPARQAASLRDALAPFSLRRRACHCWALGALPSLQIRLLTMPKPRTGQASQMVYWAFRRELPFDAEATQFDYDVEWEYQAEGAQQVDVTAYTSLRTEVDALQALFAAAEVQLDGIVIPHFALRNLCRADWVNHSATLLLCYVGEEYTCVQIIHHGRVMLNRVFITGMHALRAAFSDRFPGWSTAAILHHWCTAEAAKQRSMLEQGMPTIRRLMQQVDRSLDAFLVQQELDEDDVHIYMAGELASVPCVMEAMQQGRESAVTPLNVMTQNHLATGVAAPQDEREARLLTMAAGTALSAVQESPNLLCLKSTRVREEQTHQRNFRLVAAVCVVLFLAVLTGYFFGQINERKRQEIDVLRTQVERARENEELGAITELITVVEDRKAELRKLMMHYAPIAVLGEVSELTPPEIQLDMIRVIWDGAPGGPGSRTRAEVVGRVHGPVAQRASHLAAYDLALENGLLLDAVTVTKSQPGTEALTFEMGITLSPVTKPADTLTSVQQGGVQ